MFLAFLLLSGCLVSRTARPIIKGYVYDAETKTPLRGCMVGNTFTDNRGYYEMKEKRYLQFTTPGTEAPPVMLRERVIMEGYQPDSLFSLHLYGGGMPKGASWIMDTIFMKKERH